MKRGILLVLGVALICCSCNRIPNRPIVEPLDTKTLAGIIKYDTDFASFYEDVQTIVQLFNETDKAKFYDITYRDLYAVNKFFNDTAEIRTIEKKWEREWNEKFGSYDGKVDSIIAYWNKYKEEHSFSRFVKIEFEALDKEYYEYIGGVKNVNFAFRLTPLKGRIDQIRFTYRYAPKITNAQYAPKHRCISTKPFNKSVVRYWEVEYSAEQELENITSAEFKRDYDILFEITDIRKDGVNYSVNDLNIPRSVSKAMEINPDGYLYKSYKKDIIKELLCSEYESYSDYVDYQWPQYLQKKFPREFELLVTFEKAFGK